MSDCIFCEIVQKRISSKIAFESEKVLAFHDVQPQAPVHILIIPKEHLSSVMDIQSDQGSLALEMVLAAQKIAKQEKIDSTGFRLTVNFGPDAGQSVGHYHMHLLGKRKLSWPPG